MSFENFQLGYNNNQQNGGNNGYTPFSLQQGFQQPQNSGQQGIQGIPNIQQQVGGYNPQAMQFDQSNVPFSLQGFGQSVMDRFNFKDAFGSKEQVGWLTGGAQAAGSLFNAYNGYQQQKLAKESFNTNKKFALQNYENTSKEYNTRLADRQIARSGSTGKATSQADRQSYLDKNQVKSSLR